MATHLPGRTSNAIKNYWDKNLQKKLLDMGIDPVTHQARPDLSLLVATPSNSFCSSVITDPGAWDTNSSQLHVKAASIAGSYSDMKPPRIKDEAASFTGSYSDMKPPRIKDEAASFTGSYLDMKPLRIKDEAASLTGSYLDMKPLRLQDEATSFTGSYSGADSAWDMNAQFQLFQGHRWVISSSLGTMRALVGKLDMLLLDHASPQKFFSERVKDGMRLLKDDVEEIRSYLDELSEVEEPPPTAMCWMNEARDLSYDMEDYIDSLLFVPPNHFNKTKKKKKMMMMIMKKKKMMIKKRLKWCKQITYVRQVSEHGNKTSKRIHVSVLPHFSSKPNIAETISKFRIYIQEAIERHARYKLHCCSNLARRTFLSTGHMLPTPYEEASQIVIDERMNEFINSFATDDAADQQQLKVVSVLGSGCLGKTTLAKVVYNKIGRQFDCRAFIRLSKKPDIKRLLRSLFSQLDQKNQPLPANCNELGIQDINISKHLQDKRYLIVIDDLWDTSVWDIIRYAFPKGNLGSRIIVTTQIEDVAFTCCCDHSEHVFEMKPLDDAHSRKLFFDRLFGSENDCPIEFKQVSKEIVDICGGLPLATINIACHLVNQLQSGVPLDLLTYTRDSLRSHLWSSSTSERTRQILNFSYNNLPHHLKTCLLYPHMYPEGSIIWKDDLVKQWVAEAFIVTRKGKGQEEDWMEKTAEIYFNELIDRRFIQPLYSNYNNEVLSCTIHDVVHELIAHKAAEENFIVVLDYNRKNIALSNKVRRLFLNFGDAKYAKTPTNITKSQVRSLRFCGLFECMPCIREFKLLRVLNLQLSGHCDDHDPIDLNGISELFQLRYLKIASDVCIQLPKRMRGLQCLETLDVTDATRVTAVPWDIVYLPHLLHLTLPVDTNLLDWVGSMSDSVISLWSLGKLNHLQDLHLTSSSTHPSYHLERSMEALGSLIGGHGNLKTIVVDHDSSVKKYVVHGTRNVTISWDCMAPPPLLQRFESSHSCFIFFRIPKWVTQPGNLCILKIAVKALQMICIGTLRGLHALTDLSLYVETAPVEKIIFDKPGFSVLRHFKLRFATGIAWLIFKADAMPNLWNLKLVFNAIPRMDQHPFISSNQFPFEAWQHDTALINIEHIPSLKEISTKFVGAAADIEYVLKIGVYNHPSNPKMDVQWGDYSSYGDKRTKQKQRQDEVLEEKPDEYEKTFEMGILPPYLRFNVINHPSNLKMGVQLGDYSSYRDDRTKQKQRPDEVVEETEDGVVEETPDEIDECDKTFEMGIFAPCLRFSNNTPEPSSRMYVPAKKLTLKELLTVCATAVEDRDTNRSCFAELRSMVSVSGEPLERLGAYMLEALIARSFSSGHLICKSLECNVENFISYRNLLCGFCLYFKLGYMSANGAIVESIKGEGRIHIIDFCICDGVQWVTLLQALGKRPGGAPAVRITGIDDSVPAYGRGSSNLELVGSRLRHIASVNNIPFEFHAVAVSASQLEEGHLGVIPGEVVVVNFNLGLHTISDADDESSLSQRDRILRLVKSMSPRVVTLVEQELNTNDTTTFAERFVQTLDYYTTVFESIDVARRRDDWMRIKIEQHCLGKEMVNLIACEGAERVERHELFELQWKPRLMKAGFRPAPLSSLVNDKISDSVFFHVD